VSIFAGADALQRERPHGSTPILMGQLARVLLWAESGVWAILGVLLVAGGVVVPRWRRRTSRASSTSMNPDLGTVSASGRSPSASGAADEWLGIWTGVGLRRNRRAAPCQRLGVRRGVDPPRSRLDRGCDDSIPGAVTVIVNVLIPGRIPGVVAGSGSPEHGG